MGVLGGRGKKEKSELQVNRVGDFRADPDR